MKNLKLKRIITIFLISSLPVLNAQPPDRSVDPQIVDVTTSADQLEMTTTENVQNVTMTIKGPDGSYSQQYLGDSEFAIDSDNINALKDGTYHYEFTATSDKLKQNSYKQTIDNGRAQTQKRSRQAGYESIIQSGYLVVKDGQIVTDDLTETVSGEYIE